MSYVSIGFFLFVAVTFAVYYLFPAKKYSWCVLLAASYFFYLFASIKYCAFILITTVTTYFAAIKIDTILMNSKATIKANREVWDKEQRKRYKEAEKRKARKIATLLIVLNFGILFFLKYYNFTVENINRILNFSAIGIPTLRLFLPLGISFYTFQSMGYLIDVFRGDIRADRNIGKFALFVSFFPTIIQGPISRHNQLAAQLYEPHSANWLNFKYGIELMLWGYFKKIVIADRVLGYVTVMMDKQAELNGTALVIVLLVYAVQLYCDFSGGIDISRGVAKLFGIDLALNFRQPYFSTTLADFWNRWHISLGAWMKTYVFYPLALSKSAGNITTKLKNSKFGNSAYGQYFAGALPGAIASLIVFLLVGLWHGAEWRYVLFGLWNGLVIMTSLLIKPFTDKLIVLLHINEKSGLFRLFRIVRTFIIVSISNITDVISSARDFFTVLGRIFTKQSIIAGVQQFTNTVQTGVKEYILVVIFTMVVFLVDVFHECRPNTSLREVIDSKKAIVEWLVLYIGIMVILLFGIYGPTYDPADFVYMQF